MAEELGFPLERMVAVGAGVRNSLSGVEAEMVLIVVVPVLPNTGEFVRGDSRVGGMWTCRTDDVVRVDFGVL